MEAIRQELERLYQMVEAREAALDEREQAVAAAMEMLTVDPAVRAAFRDGITEERSRVLALIDQQVELLRRGTVSHTVLRTLRRYVEGER